MSKAPFRIALLNAEHDRSTFNSGSKPLDSYLKQQVTQDSRRRMTACFVAIDAENRIAGYYTLASASMLLSELPADIGKKLPRYPSVPAVRLGRLAVDQNFQGQGLGGALLADALDRAIRPEIAACAMVVNAKDDRAAMFYHHHGFIILPTAKMTLFYTLNRKFNTSPSLTTYSLPSARILPASLAPCSPLQAMKSS